MADRYRNRGGTSWILWAIIGLAIILALIFLIPLFGEEDETVEPDDELVDDPEARVPALVVDSVAHAGGYQLADGSHVVVML